MTRSPAPQARQLPIAVLGCGVISQVKHLPNLLRHQDRFAVVSICDPDLAALEQCSRWAPFARKYNQVEELFAEADRFDAVLVASSGSHVAEVAAAARLGKHVFVEKPLALTSGQGRELVAEIGKAGVVCMVGYMKRYAPAAGLLLDDAAREPLRVVRAELVHPPEDAYLIPVLGRARETAMSLLDFVRAEVMAGSCAKSIAATLGHGASLCSRVGHFLLATSVIHDVNLVRAALGNGLEVANASFWNGGLAGQATLTASSGAVALLSYAFVDAGSYSERLVLIGNHRRFEASFPSPYLTNLPVHVREEIPADRGAPQWLDRHVSYADPFELELLAFHEGVVEGREIQTDALDALGDLEIVAEIARRGVNLDHWKKEEPC